MSASTVRAALSAARATLTAAGIEDPARDARALMGFALGIPPDRVLLHEPDTLADEVAARFHACVTRRRAREPVAQIVGQRRFWGRMFRVTRDTLDPRPETEVLVAAALDEPFARMLDLGTGTGCILLSCLADRPHAAGTGTDISAAALSVAAENAQALGLGSRASFLRADWFSGIEGRFDLIVANPPYIAADEMGGLAPDVRDWEPHQALTPGGDGLDPYRVIAQGAGARLLSGGRLMVEVGPTQAEAVMALFDRAGLDDLRVLRDFDGRNRVVIGRKP